MNVFVGELYFKLIWIKGRTSFYVVEEHAGVFVMLYYYEYAKHLFKVIKLVRHFYFKFYHVDVKF